MTVGERITYRRKELGLTQEELALKLGYKTRNAVYQFEKAENMKLSLIKKFAVALNCSTSYLIGNEDMTVGDRIKARRESLGMSQGELADIMDITRQAVSKAETHTSNITFETVSKFAKALKCSEALLLGLTDNIYQDERTKQMLNYFEQLNTDQQDLIINLMQNMI